MRGAKLLTGCTFKIHARFVCSFLQLQIKLNCRKGITVSSLDIFGTIYIDRGIKGRLYDCFTVVNKEDKRKVLY